MGDPAKKDPSLGRTLGYEPVGELEGVQPEILQTLAQREHSLLSLLELTHELSVSLDPYEISDLVLFNLMGHIGTPKAAIWVLSKENRDRAVLLRSYGIVEEKARATGAICGANLMRIMNEVRAPVLVDELDELTNDVDRMIIERAEIGVFAPIFSRSNLLGYIALGHRIGNRPYETVDKQVLQSSLGILGVALENTSLYGAMLEKNRQLAQANDNLIEANKAKSEFLRNVNHELRTPLTIITSYAQWLISEEEGDGERKEFLGTILAESKKLNGLLERVLDFSALSADSLEINLTITSIQPTLEQFYMNRHLGVSEGLREFKYDADSILPVARFDLNRLRQILEMFVDNAVKFTPPGSRIDLRAFASEENGQCRVVVEVSDNGPGIPADRMRDIFVSFRQGDGSTDRHQGGMGMGLAFARELADRMGAEIGCRSELGEGATFWVSLPAFDR